MGNRYDNNGNKRKSGFVDQAPCPIVHQAPHQAPCPIKPSFKPSAMQGSTKIAFAADKVKAVWTWLGGLGMALGVELGGLLGMALGVELGGLLGMAQRYLLVFPPRTLLDNTIFLHHTTIVKKHSMKLCVHANQNGFVEAQHFTPVY
jgi:hypothetical protein